MKQTGEISQKDIDIDELMTLTKENERLKKLAKLKEEELRNIHTSKAHCNKRKASTEVHSKIRGDVIL